LLVVHGTYDDNVQPPNTQALFDALIRAGKRFEMMNYPMRKHDIGDRDATVHPVPHDARVLEAQFVALGAAGTRCATRAREQSNAPTAEHGRHERGEEKPRLRGEVRLDDHPPHVRCGQQAEEDGGDSEIRFHGVRSRR
jgi:hypothetical protein